MKSNTKSMSSSLIGSNCRRDLTEWLITFGTRWVEWHELYTKFKLGYPEKEGYVERRNNQEDFLQFRLTDKGLEFINDAERDG
jgi:hypothetical protein